MMIPASYISTFLPVQDLDELWSSTGIAPLSSDDLFLVSQLSAYATGTANAVALSKKLSYGQFRNKLSADFSVNDIKISIDNLSNDVHDLFIYTVNSISGLSDSIMLSTYTLSTYSNTLCMMLSSEVDTNFVRKYEQTCALIKYDDAHRPYCDFAESVYLSDGHLAVTSWRPLSDLIVPKDWRVVAGAIAGDSYGEPTLCAFNGQVSIIYNVKNDCYLNCCISAYENDSYSPIQMWIKSSLTPDSGVLYKTFNNPGGFSGKPFYNYYHVSVPLTKLVGSGTGNTTVVLKYENPQHVFQQRGYASFTEYYFYAVPSKDDLSNYVNKPEDISLPQYGNERHVCEIAFNEDGLITSATSVYYGPATDTKLGLVQISSNANASGPDYFLKLKNNAAYIHVPRASNSTYGTVKFASPSSTEIPLSCHAHVYGNVLYNTDLSHFLSCSLENEDGKATTFIPCATDDIFGVVKLSSGFYSFDVDQRKSLSTYLNLDKTGHAFVTVPLADDGEFGLIKTGTPDTSEIRITRSVYVGEDGVAQVNVANQIGVGPWQFNTPNSGYTKRIELPLSNFVNSTSYEISTFLGNVAQLSTYGTNIVSKQYSVNGWFMAQLVLDGTSNNYGANDPALQIVCDGIAVTTLHPKCIQTSIGKHFTYSTYLGVFRGSLYQDNNTVLPNRLFAIASNYTDFGDNKLYFLIKEGNFNT